MTLLNALWRYRGYISGSVKREFELRYVRSVFGFVWTILEPLSMILVYTLIFSTVMRARLPGLDDSWSYSIYLCSGILFWTFFAEVVNRCQIMFIAEASLLKKSNFPRLTLPIVIALSASLNFAIFMAIFMVFLLVIDRFPGIEVLAIIPLAGLLLAFAIGLGVLTGTLNVFFRDVGKSVGILLTFWFWMTPIVYPIEIIPETLQQLIHTLNPLIPLVYFSQQVMLGTELPSLSTLMFPALATSVLLVLGYLAFRRLAPDMVDEL